MPSSKHRVRDIVSTLTLNHQGKHYDAATAFGPLLTIVSAVEMFHESVAAINVDRNLTPEGKSFHRQAAGAKALDAIGKLRDGRLPGLDADIAGKRKALVKPDQLDQAMTATLRNELLKLSPMEIRVAYNSANDVEKQHIEAATLAFGRRPVKSENGITWETLLPADVLTEAQAARLAAKYPVESAQLAELESIRESTSSIAAQAVKEITDVVPDADAIVVK
jgi:hypothetical protein